MIKPIEKYIVKPENLDQMRDQDKLNIFINHLQSGCEIKVLGVAKEPYSHTVSSNLPNRSLKSFIGLASLGCNIASETLNNVQKHDQYSFSFVDGLMATSVNQTSLSAILEFYQPMSNIGSQLLYDQTLNLLLDDSFESSIELIANVVNTQNEIVQTIQFPISVESHIQSCPVYPYFTDVMTRKLVILGNIGKQCHELKSFLETDQNFIDLYANVALTTFRRTALYFLSRNPHLYVLQTVNNDLYAVIPSQNVGIKNPKFFGVSLAQNRYRDLSRWSDYALFKSESNKWCGFKYDCSLKPNENLRVNYSHTENLQEVQMVFENNEQTNAFFIGDPEEHWLPKELI